MAVTAISAWDQILKGMTNILIFGNEDNPRGKAWDYMTNILIFGMDPLRVDLIGKWLGGHEPGNFGLFHIAI